MKSLILSMLIVFSLNAGLNDDNQEELKEKLKAMPVEKFARILANKTASAVPIKIDAITTVTKVIALDNSISYFKSIDLNHEIMKGKWENKSEYFKTVMFDQDSKMVCRVDFLNHMIINKGLVLKYYYTDRDYRPLFNYSVNKNDCLKLEEE
ncbi:hypothetical protein CP960_08370 [Malaciobacter halophilus]|uniref:Uncharacterized protein n=1 Tax=Malaciobacter halophilus TaxID=197482 RepID=A0A2N1J1X4_9BACT|nr:hypothetical protein [Malaciobacter halophilus]AXH10069.1 hypothetical protein AHALO_1704 [Malaciobacter halophilus]PKI80555.1 hypothetical protein CP960_08370 [Malaciobacter halophilus]